MIRLILLILLIAAMLIAAVALMSAVQTVTNMVTQTDEDTMPETFRRVSYVLLVILLIGLSFGWLGAA